MIALQATRRRLFALGNATVGLSVPLVLLIMLKAVGTVDQQLAQASTRNLSAADASAVYAINVRMQKFDLLFRKSSKEVRNLTPKGGFQTARH